jgi:transcription-repair coupling factor (superfamily II helicase)
MLARKILSAGGRVTLAAAPEGRDGQVLAELAAEAPAGVLHVARDEGRMTALAEVAGFFRPEVEVVRLPAWDCLPYDRVSPHPTVEARRMDAFCRLAATPSRGRLILTTVNAALQRTPARERVAGATFRARPGERVDLATARLPGAATASTEPARCARPANSPSAAASSTSFRRARRLRCASTSSATSWKTSAPSTR